MVGNASGQVRLLVERHSDRATLNGVVRDAAESPVVVNTDDWRGYDRLAETGHPRTVVCHVAGEWARDDGNGVRKVHNQDPGGSVDGATERPAGAPWSEQNYLYKYTHILSGGTSSSA